MKLEIVPTTARDYQDFERWFRDKESLKWFPAPFCNLEYNAAFHAYWIRREDNRVRTIRVEGRPVGYVGAEWLDPFHKTAAIQLLVGDTGARNSGVGFKAASMMIEELFRVDGLRMVYTWSAASNAASLRVIKKIGFKKAGVFRSAHLVDDRYEDRILYDLLREEFLKW